MGIACSGLFHELYPFWSAFFRTLGAGVVLSGRSGEELLEQGKNNLAAEMCYPIEVLIGHYHELVKKKIPITSLFRRSSIWNRCPGRRIGRDNCVAPADDGQGGLHRSLFEHQGR